MSYPFVWIAGAGPGKPAYITEEVRRILPLCDCLLYDALLDPELLELCAPQTERLYVGKRSGKHSMKQEEINALLLQKAGEGKKVLRLKGGDPFLFGRGGEECLALQEAGIPYAVIPGVTSAFSVPMAAGIPVTHRGTAQMVTVVTGHTAEGELDYGMLAGLPSTLVFLMGVHALPRITRSLIEQGMDPEKPAAVISNGTRPEQYVLRSTVGKIADEAAEDDKVVTPAVIVVGDVATLQMQSPKSAPFHVTVCGTESFCGKMEARIPSYGGNVTALPYVSIRPVDLPDDPDVTEDFRSYTDLVFTGRNAIDCFFALLEKNGRDLRILGDKRISVIGEATGRYLSERYHIKADLCPEVFTSDGLADLLIQESRSDGRYFIPRSKQGNTVIADRLKEAGIPFRELPVYESVFASSCAEDVRVYADRAERRLKRYREADPLYKEWIVFASAEGVRKFFAHGGTIPDGVLPLCIGPYTEQELKKNTKIPSVVAQKASAEGLIDKMIEGMEDESIQTITE